MVLFVVNALWCIFVLTGWLTVWQIYTGYLASDIFYSTIVLGLLLYVLKLYFKNKVALTELNYLTIAYYLICYLFILFLGSYLWAAVYYIFHQIDPEYFRTLFVTDELFYTLALKMRMVVASMTVSASMLVGMHRGWVPLRFTNKVSIFEPVFLVVSIGWFVHLGFMTLFMSSVTYFAMPDEIKALLGKALSFIYRRDIDLVNRKIENNNPDDAVVAADKKQIVINILVEVVGYIIAIIVTIPLSAGVLFWVIVRSYFKNRRDNDVSDV